MTNRREFLACSALAFATSTGTLVAGAASRIDDGPILDTHQHLWDLDLLNPPWVVEAPEILRKKYDSEAYARESVGLNIVSCLYMEIDMAPEKADFEAEHILALCRSGKTPTRGAILSGRPEQSAFAKRVKRWSRASEVRGFRRILHVDHAPPQTCLSKQFEKSMATLADHGLTFDLCMRVDELDDGAKLAGRCADTQFIVDHCGNADPVAFQKSSQQKRKPLHDADAWRRSMERFATHDNVACKISGIVARAPEGWKSEHLVPIIDFCLETFGPDRVIFGSDWPVCRLGGSLKQWVMALREIVKDRPGVQQRALFSQNAQKIYGATLNG
jgi:predicted TIM-barrel fold metal-dependent hydrolase